MKWKTALIAILMTGVVIMALHDVDKNGQQRLSPTINSKDNLPQDVRMAHGTTQVTNKDEQDTDGSVSVNESVIKSVDSDGRTVALMGYQENGFGASSFGFKVAQPGYDAETATDDQLVMSSAFNSFKIVATGTASLPAASAGGTANVTVSHNLGYAPIVIAHQVAVGGSQMLPLTGFSVATNQFLFHCEVEFIDEDSFQIWSYAASGGGGFPAQTIKYYLLREVSN